MPARVEAETARFRGFVVRQRFGFVRRAERRRRERLQRVPHHQRLAHARRRLRIGRIVVAHRGVEQFRSPPRTARAWSCRAGPCRTSSAEHAPGGRKQLQEQVAVGVAPRGVADAALRACRAPWLMRLSGSRAVARRERRFVHAEQADRRGTGSAASAPCGRSRRRRTGTARARRPPDNSRGEMLEHHGVLDRLRRSRRRARPAANAAIAAQALEHRGVGAVARSGANSASSRPPSACAMRAAACGCAQPRRAPRAAARAGAAAHPACRPTALRGPATARCRRSSDLVVAAGVAQQQAVERERAACRRRRRPRRGVRDPRASRPQRAPAACSQSCRRAARGLVDAETRGQRRHRQQVEHVVQASGRSGSSSRRRKTSRERRAAPADWCRRACRESRAAYRARRRTPRRRAARRVDVGRQHGDVARLRACGRRRAGASSKRAQLVVQHLHFAQARVAGVELQAGIVGGRPARAPGARCARCGQDRAAGCRARRPADAPSSVSRVRFGEGAPSRSAACTTSPLPSAAMKSRPAWPHACSSGLSSHRRGTDRRAPAAQSAAQRSQVAPVRARRRGQVEVLARRRAPGWRSPAARRARCSGRRTRTGATATRRASGAVAAEPLQVLVDAPRAMRAPAADAPPQLRPAQSSRARPALPGQQPVAAPGLVFLEAVGQRSGQRPGFDADRRPLRRKPAQRRRRVAARSSRSRCQRSDVGVEVVGAGAAPRLASSARSTNSPGVRNSQVGADAQAFGQRLLQPAAHRQLRDQHDVRRQPVAAPARDARNSAPAAPARTSSALEW